MNSRIEEINEFLRYAAQIYRNNPEAKITPDAIYYLMKNYSYPGYYNFDEEKKQIQFDHFEEHFKNNPNLNVYNDSRQPDFEQFVNSYSKNAAKCAKLYLSFDENDIYECADIIFDFIANNKIATTSKIANHVRSDDVVLRIENIEDAKKVISFINSNERILRSAKRTNPFLLRVGVVGIAYDKYLSYKDYKKMHNQLNNVSVDELKIFIQYYRQKTFNELQGIEKLAENNRDIHPGYKVLNHEQVSRLLLNELSSDYTFNDYESFLKKCKDDSLSEEIASYYQSSLNNKNIDKKIYEEEKERETIASTLVNSYIDHCIQYKEYNTLDKIEAQLKGFVNGNSRAITNDNNYRENFVKFVRQSDIEQVLKDRKVKSSLQNEYNKHLEKMDINEKYQLFLKACEATYKKYGSNQLVSAITSAYYNNDYCRFTNDEENNNSFRDNLSNHVSHEELEQFVKHLIRESNYAVMLDSNYALLCAQYLISCYNNNNTRTM